MTVNHALLRALCLACMVLATSAEASQPRLSGEATRTDIFTQIFDAMMEPSSRIRRIEKMVEFYARQLQNDPEIKRAERSNPGFAKAIALGVRPAMISFNDRVLALYRPRFASLFREGLSPQEAREILDVLRSPLGRRLLTLTDDAYTGETTARAAASGGAITEDDLSSDIRDAASRLASDLNGNERRELRRTVRETPSLQRLAVLWPRIQALNVDMANEPQNAAEQTKAASLARSAAAAHIAKFRK